MRIIARISSPTLKSRKERIFYDSEMSGGRKAGRKRRPKSGSR
jgi:hypothetical protein